MTKPIPVLTIDGPSGSGKGTISQAVAKRLQWHYLDSGAIYRAVGLAAAWESMPDAQGAPGARNDLCVVSLEHKLGIHASPTCVMSYGENLDGNGGECIGELIGHENDGLKCMFTMMNAARINVGRRTVSFSL